MRKQYTDQCRDNLFVYTMPDCALVAFKAQVKDTEECVVVDLTPSQVDELILQLQEWRALGLELSE